MKKKLPRVKVLDIVIAAIGLGLVLLSVSLVYSNSRGRLMVHISGAEGEWLQPLDRPAVIEVPGPLGITVVHIENNSVHIEKSPCPNQTCVAAGDISAANLWIACLPNNVFVNIEGAGDPLEALDASSF
ncbi:MAG: NusG domain II-containing protein [Spirochaetia bacterium]|nr:NusG domain II-containing protein [Spirochaetia bacterium]